MNLQFKIQAGAINKQTNLQLLLLQCSQSVLSFLILLVHHLGHIAPAVQHILWHPVDQQLLMLQWRLLSQYLQLILLVPSSLAGQYNLQYITFVIIHVNKTCSKSKKST